MEVAKIKERLYSLGYMLYKDTKRNWSLHHQGGYMIVNYRINGCVAGADFDLSLDDVKDWLDYFFG